MHPAKVPFEVETETAGINRKGHHRSIRGILRHHEQRVIVVEHCRIELFQDTHTCFVHVRTVTVVDLLVWFMVFKVQIDHAVYRIYAESVHMEFPEPEHRCRYEE